MFTRCSEIMKSEIAHDPRKPTIRKQPQVKIVSESCNVSAEMVAKIDDYGSSNPKQKQ